jgi:hypothetical protein
MESTSGWVKSAVSVQADTSLDSPVGLNPPVGLGNKRAQVVETLLRERDFNDLVRGEKFLNWLIETDYM